MKNENNINNLRKEKNISKEDLAKILGVSPRQIQRYENNNDTVSVAKAIKIADYLDVPLDLLFNRPNFLIPNYQKEDFYSEEQLIFNQLDQSNKKIIKKMMNFLLEEQK
ncbi:helix-turn-helix domain-containing protein [Halolactibacillus sp. JCM 19043]|uniref:helix-turn-helix domain-containing protein n=1 Tax=Halolactibacillus sp. JCM 19043 TaxID=1460638 RepID=UPI0009E85A7B|nr:helix-turn-helix transcriptional regulator [Halolactibacillus sp. JCM 19043]